MIQSWQSKGPSIDLQTLLALKVEMESCQLNVNCRKLNCILHTKLREDSKVTCKHYSQEQLVFIQFLHHYNKEDVFCFINWLQLYVIKLLTSLPKRYLSMLKRIETLGLD